jgi:hypothetical protein
VSSVAISEVMETVSDVEVAGILKLVTTGGVVSPDGGGVGGGGVGGPPWQQLLPLSGVARVLLVLEMIEIKTTHVTTSTMNQVLLFIHYPPSIGF